MGSDEDKWKDLIGSDKGHITTYISIMSWYKGTCGRMF